MTTPQIEAIRAMLPLLEDERRMLVECNSELTLVRGKIRPVPDTLEPDVAERVAEYDRAIGLGYRAMGIE